MTKVRIESRTGGRTPEPRIAKSAFVDMGKSLQPLKHPSEEDPSYCQRNYERPKGGAWRGNHVAFFRKFQTIVFVGSNSVHGRPRLSEQPRVFMRGTLLRK